jgi:hypothetical protein
MTVEFCTKIMERLYLLDMKMYYKIADALG